MWVKFNRVRLHTPFNGRGLSASAAKRNEVWKS